MKNIALLFLVMMTSLFFAQAQDFGQIVAGAVKDGNKYAADYLRPFGEGEIYNLSRGWYSTAKAHKLLGVDISINAQFAIVPSGKENFTFNNSDYTSFKLNGSNTSASLPTFVGGSSSQVINVTTTANGQNVTTSFTAPSGIGDNLKKNLSFLPTASPLPIAQVGVGLLKHTDIKIRYLPKKNFNDIEIGVMGLAIQHEFSDYLPFIKKVPFLHLSALAGYSSIDASYKPSFGTNASVQSTDAVAGYKISSFTLQGIASAKFALFEIYAAIGYSKGSSTVDLNGNYSITYKTGNLPPNDKVIINQKDPIALSYDGGGVSNTVGFRLNILILKIYADYTFAKYNTMGVGMALSFR